MAADVFAVMIDPTTGAVVAERWIGGNRVRERVSEVLRRPPDHEAVGFFSWGRITASEASRVSEVHYADGLTPAEIEQLAVELPVERFWCDLDRCVAAPLMILHILSEGRDPVGDVTEAPGNAARALVRDC